MANAKSKFVAFAASAALVAMLGLAGCGSSSASSSSSASENSSTGAASASSSAAASSSASAGASGSSSAAATDEIGDAGFANVLTGVDGNDVQCYYAEGAMGTVLIVDTKANTYESYTGDIENLDDNKIQITNAADGKPYVIEVEFTDDGTQATFENGQAVEMESIEGETFVTVLESVGESMEKTN